MGIISSFLGKDQSDAASKAAALSAQAQLQASREQQQLMREFYNQTRDDYAGQREAGGQSMSQLMSLYGMGDNPEAANQAFNDYLNSTGYQFRVNEGDKQIRALAAKNGMLGSGDMYKALQNYGQGTASQEFGNYTGQLHNMANWLPSANQGLAQAGAGYSANIGNAIQGGADALSSMYQQQAMARMQQQNRMGGLVGMGLGAAASAFGGPLFGMAGDVMGSSSGLGKLFGDVSSNLAAQ